MTLDINNLIGSNELLGEEKQFYTNKKRGKHLWECCDSVHQERKSERRKFVCNEETRIWAAEEEVMLLLVKYIMLLFVGRVWCSHWQLRTEMLDSTLQIYILVVCMFITQVNHLLLHAIHHGKRPLKNIKFYAFISVLCMLIKMKSPKRMSHSTQEAWILRNTWPSAW